MKELFNKIRIWAIGILGGIEKPKPINPIPYKEERWEVEELRAMVVLHSGFFRPEEADDKVLDYAKKELKRLILQKAEKHIKFEMGESGGCLDGKLFIVLKPNDTHG